MGATVQGYGQSILCVKNTGIEIWLPFQVFGRAWAVVMTRLLEAIAHQQVIEFTPRIMTQRAQGEDAPCWKESCVEALSWFLFLLKVPPSHELVQLWQVIDWGKINQIAAPVYQNAHAGRLAWAPAQLVAILVLMFLYGVAHETTIVARIQENIVWCWFCGFGLFGPFPAHDALYEFRKRMGIERFEQVLTMVVQACLQAGLVANDLVHFDLTAVIAAGHRWSPYERAVILTRALIRYLELAWAEQTPEQPFPEALRILAAEVALEVLPHKGLDNTKPGRVVKSVERWSAKAEGHNPAWQEASETVVRALSPEAEPLPLQEAVQ